MTMVSSLRKSSVRKPVAIALLICNLLELLFPLSSYALTSGPSQPEVQSFEPVSMNQTVNPQTGDFTYSIDLGTPDYPINIAYHSGVKMEEEASNVGYGWNMSIGVLNRQMRGLPDDYNGEEVIKEMYSKPNWTVGVDVSFSNLEVAGWVLNSYSPYYYLGTGVADYTFVAGSAISYFQAASTYPATDTFYIDYITVQKVTPDTVPVYGRSEYVYSFNGKMKDNEINGEGGVINFGDRPLDTRIGASGWLGVDKLKKLSPAWTPYRFGFNNPILYGDNDGRFEIDKKTAEKFPMLNTYLQKISVTYQGKPEQFKDAFKEFSQLSNDQINKMLEYRLVENGTPIVPNQETPRIEVKNMFDLAGETPTSVTIEKGHIRDVKNEGKIVLSESIVKKFEKAEKKFLKSGKDNDSRKAINLLLEATIFHEGTHYGDALDGSSDKTELVTERGSDGKWRAIQGSATEGGEDFERKAYGDVINSEKKAKSIVRKSDKRK